MIRLYNSMTRSVEEFVPQNEYFVTMYVCGPTVYDTPHLGNARPAVIFDVLYRLLRQDYGVDGVEYARNYTDVDDKIIARAAKENIEIATLTEQTIATYENIMRELNVMVPNDTPRATGNILPMKGMIAQLMLKGYAYEVEGHVFFDVAAYPSHGVLSGHQQDALENHRTIKNTDLKRNPSDFVLWKPSAENEPGWDSPWGRGRPGWHIECSAMIDSIFASQTIDIHGGGADLRFPHHECEITQFHACNERQLARYWLHNAMVTVDGQKMAKSTCNFVTVQDVVDQGIHGHAIRLALLSTHYRSPLDWTSELVTQAARTLTDWHRALELVTAVPEENEHARFILEPLRNDLNTTLTITRIHDLMGQIASNAESIGAGVRYAAWVLGIPLTDHDTYLRGFDNRSEIDALIAERVEARRNRNWAESDRIRAILGDMGLAIEDGPAGTTWRRA